jgi:hypothetical protein
MSSAWLAALAYAMTFCFERLADAWRVPPEIMGLTLGAAVGLSRMHYATPGGCQVGYMGSYCRLLCMPIPGVRLVTWDHTGCRKYSF